jgi:hypothetical protein
MEEMQLNYNAGVQKKWAQDTPNRVDRNWPGLHG